MPHPGPARAAVDPGAPPAPAGDEAGQVDEPVAVGAQHEVRGAATADGGGDGGALGGGGFRVAPAQDGPGWCRRMRARPVSGSTSVETPDVGQLELTGVDDLDGQDLVAVGQGRAAGGPTRSARGRGSRTAPRPCPAGGWSDRWRRSAAVRSTGPLPSSGAVVISLCRVAASAGRPPRAGTMTRPWPVAITAPMRLADRPARHADGRGGGRAGGRAWSWSPCRRRGWARGRPAW